MPQFCRYALAYTVVPLLTCELQEFVSLWNSHRIHPSAYSGSPSGIPDDLYQMALEFGELLGSGWSYSLTSNGNLLYTGTRDYKQDIDNM